MKICIIGTGYVGLVTGVCFSEMGNDVWCVDNNKDKIEVLNKLQIPIYEPGLEDLLRQNYAQGRLKFTADIKYAIENTDLCFIAVGTPEGECGNTDLQYVLKAAEDIGRYITHHMYIINKSTVPVGTAEKVTELIQEELNKRCSEITFEVISNPEFLKEGAAINDCMRPDRIIIGTDNPNALKVMRELYLPFVRNTENFICMDAKSAEMTKYAANSMLAVKISFINEISNLCERVGADINKVRMGIGSDPRIGYSFIYAGCGYGGSCFPKDIKSLIHKASENGYDMQILKAVEAVNLEQKYLIPEKIVKKYGSDLSEYTFGVWGLSFKPDTDDMREASSITIINELINHGANIKVYDPKAMNEARTKYLKGKAQISYVENKYEALVNADAMILITEWKEFRSPDFDGIKKLLKEPVIFDGRNQYDAMMLKELGFEYYQIGVKHL